MWWVRLLMAGRARFGALYAVSALVAGVGSSDRTAIIGDGVGGIGGGVGLSVPRSWWPGGSTLMFGWVVALIVINLATFAPAISW